MKYTEEQLIGKQKKFEKRLKQVSKRRKWYMNIYKGQGGTYLPEWRNFGIQSHFPRVGKMAGQV
jgi:abortive infection bacteriophage resistance protein